MLPSNRLSIRWLRAAAFLALCSAPAFAGDWYVDVVQGDDAHGGTSPGDAWKTITKALDTVPTPPPGSTETIHVAPGTYSTVTGEVFALELRPGLQVVGGQGSAATMIDLPAGATAFSVLSELVGAGYTFGPDTIVAGFTITGGHRGVEIGSDRNPASPILRDLVVRGASGAGISVSASGSSGTAHPRLERVRLVQNGIGLDVDHDGANCSVYMEDSEILRSAGEGIDIHSSGGLPFDLHRVTIAGNGSDGIKAAFVDFGNIVVNVLDSAIVGNGGDGFNGVQAFGLGSSLIARFFRTTIADNANVGVRAEQDLTCPCFHLTTVESSIVYGNADDLLFNASNVTVSFSNIGDGDFAGTSGNISADPLFVDAPGGDYRLRFGSPCIEGGNLATATGILDLVKTKRSVDGDFDTVELPDMGALEHVGLRLVGEPTIGSTVELELWGATGSQTRLLLSTQPLLSVPIVSPFGDIDIVTAGADFLGSFPAAEGPPGSLLASIPGAPGLVGLPVSVQGLNLSASGAATTNAIGVAILP